MKYTKERNAAFKLLMSMPDNFMRIWTPRELMNEWNLLMPKKHPRFSTTRESSMAIRHINSYITFSAKGGYGSMYIFVKSRKFE